MASTQIPSPWETVVKLASAAAAPASTTTAGCLPFSFDSSVAAGQAPTRAREWSSTTGPAWVPRPRTTTAPGGASDTASPSLRRGACRLPSPPGAAPGSTWNRRPSKPGTSARTASSSGSRSPPAGQVVPTGWQGPSPSPWRSNGWHSARRRGRQIE